MIPEINLEDFKYELPEEKIAFFPKRERGKSNLLVAYKNSKKIIDANFSEISSYLPEDSILFVNKTKVLDARIRFQKETGAYIEFFLSKPLLPSTANAITLSAKKTVVWECMVGGRIKSGVEYLINKEISLLARVLTKEGNICTIQFDWTGDLTFSEVLSVVGNVPLPPYIKREAEEKDKQRYQTVFAKEMGSVAAPTAGLHFTEEILKDIENKKINIEELTLHVGLGTFNPIKDNDIANHKMHNESISISLAQVKLLANSVNNTPITAVGTTSCRTLETLYVLGNKIYLRDFNHGDLLANQWDYYNFQNKLSPQDSLNEVINYYESQNLEAIEGNTELLIIPSYDYKIINNLITNFHEPKSTLILLVAAFLGHDFQKEVYQHALEGDYYFLSYGDSNLFIND